MRAMAVAPSEHAPLKSCCCGCSLKTGAILIAVWYQLSSIYQLISLSIRIDKGYYPGGPDDQIGEILVNNEHNDQQGTFLTANYFDEPEILYTLPMMIIGVISSCFELIACIMLLVGIAKDRPGLMLPWIVIESMIVLSTTIVMAQMSIGFLSDKEFFTSGLAGLIVSIIFIMISAYLIMVVYSYYKTVQHLVHSKLCFADKKPQIVNELKLDVELPQCEKPPLEKPFVQFSDKNQDTHSEA